MSEWIPTSERLPEEGKPVLLYMKGCTEGYLVCDEILEEGQIHHIEEWFSTLEGEAEFQEITHWSELPPPPTTGRE